jgi:hypothetical protein
MKTIFTILLTFMLSATLLEASAFSKDAKYRTIKVHITSAKPLSTGKNVLVFDISKKGKAPVGAKVAVKAFMPAMPGMPAMTSLAKAKDLGNGKYEVKLNIAMGGTWQIHIFITPKEGKKSRIKTSINF